MTYGVGASSARSEINRIGATSNDYSGDRLWVKTKNNNPKWTEENKATLKQCVIDGKSGAEIAKELGFATRNAVIGQIHRMGLGHLKPKISRATGRPLQQPHHQARAVLNFKNRIAQQQTPQHRQRVVLLEAVMTTPNNDNRIPAEQRKTLLELTSCTCKWPCGNPGEEGFFFCGAITNHTVYCDTHHSEGRPMNGKGNTSHGHTSRTRKNNRWRVVKSPTYMSWEAMNARCYNPKHKWYNIYGGRGIEVCEAWRRGTPGAFANFLADMGERPAKHMTLDRKEANLGYYKNNCRWADKSTQRLNQRGMPAPIIDVEPINSIPF